MLYHDTAPLGAKSEKLGLRGALAERLVDLYSCKPPHCQSQLDAPSLADFELTCGELDHRGNLTGTIPFQRYLKGVKNKAADGRLTECDVELFSWIMEEIILRGEERGRTDVKCFCNS